VSTQQAATYQIICRLISLYTPHVKAENHQALISSEVHITEYWQYQCLQTASHRLSLYSIQLHA